MTEKLLKTIFEEISKGNYTLQSQIELLQHYGLKTSLVNELIKKAER